MGIIRTDKWLDTYIDQPEILCSKLDGSRGNGKDFYNYLSFFGMYQPSRMTKKVFEDLKEQNAWEKIGLYYKKYKKLFNGPDADIYIFPINVTNRALMRQTNGKSGVTIENDLYLFLAPQTDIKEWEALFVHEYHHAARIKKLGRKPFEFTLLDSMVLEGLAEHAVEEYCGKEYSAKINTAYSDRMVKRFWKSDFKPRLNVLKKDKIHDDLLFGKKYVPHMMGYSIGYKMIEEYKKKFPFSTEKMLEKSSNDFLDRNFLE